MNDLKIALKLLRQKRDAARDLLDHYQAVIRDLEGGSTHPERLKRPSSGLMSLEQKLDEALASEEAMPLFDNPTTFPLGKLRGLTQSKAMIVIAKHYHGFLRTQDLQRLLTKAELMKKSRNSYNMAYNLITESERFDRVSKGLYRLKGYKTSGVSELTRVQPSPRVQ